MLNKYSDGSYLDSNPSWHAERARWKADHVLEVLSKAEKKPVSICDIGCGTGLALACVASSMPQIEAVVGFESGADAPQHPDTLELIDFRRESAENCREHFDLALMLDVFEHVEDYIGFLKSCHHIADTFVFHVPLDASALSVIAHGLMATRSSVGHLHYFSRETALATLEDAGYKPVHWHFTYAAWDGPERNPNRPVNLTRRFLTRFSEEYTHRILGGMSLLVVAESA